MSKTCEHYIIRETQGVVLVRYVYQLPTSDLTTDTTGGGKKIANQSIIELCISIIQQFNPITVRACAPFAL
jgi:hypothetical protein